MTGRHKQYYRLATSLAGLTTGYFFVIGLPEPQVPFYQPYSISIPQGLGGEGRHGYHNAFIQWDRLTRQQAFLIQNMISTVEVTLGVGQAVLYATMPRTDASSDGQAWIDISGKVKMPEWRTDNFTHGMIYQPVTLNFNNVTVENEPSAVL